MASNDVQDSINSLSQQQKAMQEEVQQAQAQQAAQDHKQQALRAEHLDAEARIAAELAKGQSDIAQLQTQMQQVPVLGDISQSEEEDPDISSFKESDSGSDSDHTVLPVPLLQNGHREAGDSAFLPSADHVLPSGSNGRQRSLGQMLRQLQPGAGQPARLGNLVTLLQHDQLHAQTKEVRT